MLEKMDSVSIVLDFANIINLIAVLLLMRAIIKDRKFLKGFSVSGSFLTFVAIFSFEIVYVLLGNPISFALGLVNLVFGLWLLYLPFESGFMSESLYPKNWFEVTTN